MSNEFGAIYIVARIFISLLVLVLFVFFLFFSLLSFLLFSSLFFFPLLARAASILLVKRRYVSERLVTYLIIVVSVNLK